jgi:hypothetical protein
MNLGVGRILSAVVVAGSWLIAGVRLVLDLIGYATVPDDVGVAQTRIDQFLALVLATPWWVIWGFALISTLWLMWVSWPRPTIAAKGGPDLDTKQRLLREQRLASKEARAASPPPSPEMSRGDRNNLLAEQAVWGFRILDMNIGISHLDSPAAWLYFGCVGFNGVFDIVSHVSATGRVLVAGQELHDKIELVEHEHNQHIRKGRLFRTDLKVAVSDRAVAHIKERLATGGVNVQFESMKFTIRGDGSQTTYPSRPSYPALYNSMSETRARRPIHAFSKIWSMTKIDVTSANRLLQEVLCFQRPFVLQFHLGHTQGSALERGLSAAGQRRSGRSATIALGALDT